MKIKIKLGDGSTTSVDAWWHPSCEIGAPYARTTRPAGLWTTDTAIMARLAEVNRLRAREGIEQRDLSPGIEPLVESAASAEAPLEVYRQDETGTPWRHTGNLMRDIPAGTDELDS